MSRTKFDELRRHSLGRSVIANAAILGIIRFKKGLGGAENLGSLHVRVQGNEITPFDEALERNRLAGDLQLNSLKFIIKTLEELSARPVNVGASNSNS
jgi:hypothetical protein